jgi:hypothetical protein
MRQPFTVLPDQDFAEGMRNADLQLNKAKI